VKKPTTETVTDTQKPLKPTEVVQGSLDHLRGVESSTRKERERIASEFYQFLKWIAKHLPSGIEIPHGCALAKGHFYYSNYPPSKVTLRKEFGCFKDSHGSFACDIRLDYEKFETNLLSATDDLCWFVDNGFIDRLNENIQAKIAEEQVLLEELKLVNVTIPSASA